MKKGQCRTLTRIAPFLSLALLLAAAKALAGTHTWTGAGLNSHWSIPANWAGDNLPAAGEAAPVVLNFPSGALRLSNTNNITGLVIDGMAITEAVTNTFAGLPEGATLTTAKGWQFRITYKGGRGNDVALILLAPPAPHLTGLVRLADGNFEVTGTGQSWLTYTVLANANLATTNWVEIGSVSAVIDEHSGL